MNDQNDPAEFNEWWWRCLKITLILMLLFVAVSPLIRIWIPWFSSLSKIWEVTALVATFLIYVVTWLDIFYIGQRKIHAVVRGSYAIIVQFFLLLLFALLAISAFIACGPFEGNSWQGVCWNFLDSLIPLGIVALHSYCLTLAALMSALATKGLANAKLSKFMEQRYNENSLKEDELRACHALFEENKLDKHALKATEIPAFIAFSIISLTVTAAVFEPTGDHQKVSKDELKGFLGGTVAALLLIFNVAFFTHRKNTSREN